jgi:hypothetical protein
MKRSLLLSKVRKSSDKKPASARPRRPTKKLAASLDALANTLPELSTDPPRRGGGGSGKPSGQGSSGGGSGGMADSLERKRGLTKRREKVVKAETQRFGQNLAILSVAGAAAAAGGGGDGGAARGGAWKALRKHLESTVGGNT